MTSLHISVIRATPKPDESGNGLPNFNHPATSKSEQNQTCIQLAVTSKALVGPIDLESTHPLKTRRTAQTRTWSSTQWVTGQQQMGRKVPHDNISLGIAEPMRFPKGSCPRQHE